MEEPTNPKKPAPKLRVSCYITCLMRSRFIAVPMILATFTALLLLHLPLLRLPYFWDEAGYYIPAALDFSRSWSLTPHTTLPEGHPPLVMIYLGLAWRFFGYSTWVARTAMMLMALATVMTLYALGRRVASFEIAVWSALLLALSPLFFSPKYSRTPGPYRRAFYHSGCLLSSWRGALALCAGRFIGCSYQGNRGGSAACRVALRVAKRLGAGGRVACCPHHPDCTHCAACAACRLDALLPPRHRLLDGQPWVPKL